MSTEIKITAEIMDRHEKYMGAIRDLSVVKDVKNKFSPEEYTVQRNKESKEDILKLMAYTFQEACKPDYSDKANAMVLFMAMNETLKTKNPTEEDLTMLKGKMITSMKQNGIDPKHMKDQFLISMKEDVTNHMTELQQKDSAKSHETKSLQNQHKNKIGGIRRG